MIKQELLRKTRWIDSIINRVMKEKGVKGYIVHDSYGQNKYVSHSVVEQDKNIQIRPKPKKQAPYQDTCIHVV